MNRDGLSQESAGQIPTLKEMVRSQEHIKEISTIFRWKKFRQAVSDSFNIIRFRVK